MTFPAIILLAVLLGAVLIAIRYLGKYRRETEGTPNEVKMCEVTGDACFGGAYCHVRRHLKAERNLPEYYEDEELDRFRGKKPDDYTEDETKEWREVLGTLRPEEVLGWVGSIHRRGLHIPTGLRTGLKSVLSAD